MASFFNSLTGNKHTSHSQSSDSSASVSSSTTESTTAAKNINIPVLHEATTAQHGTYNSNGYDSTSSLVNSSNGYSGSGYASYGSLANTMSSESAASMSSSAASSMAESTDNAITRSEERLTVGSRAVEAGTAGLHKYVTSEHVSTAVPLTSERVVVEREPITAANIDMAMAGPEFKESEYAIKVNKEVATAEKETVPIERIRMRKEKERGQQFVEADLRKEHVDVLDSSGTAIVQEKRLNSETAETASRTAATARTART